VARSGEITATNGVIDPVQLLRLSGRTYNEAPLQTNVHIVESSAPPGGVGEPGVPPFIAALCNAVYSATGKRVRNCRCRGSTFTGKARLPNFIASED